MSFDKLIIVGLVVNPVSLKQLKIFQGFIKSDYGLIKQVGSMTEFETMNKHRQFKDYKIILMDESQFIMPGFVDCHTHAPQFPNLGIGLDRTLLEWLDKYTFPLERQYSDEQFAAQVYDKVVKRLLQTGTTTACYFGSLDLKGTMQLVKSVQKIKQRALVGKVSMNIKNSANYYNKTDVEVKEVETFIRNVLDLNNDLVQPIITPRFAVSCDGELMTKLSELAAKYDCRIQSHISESIGEINHVMSVNPDCDSYAHVYDKSHLLNKKCIMAHAVHLSDAEMSLLASRGVSVAHCPASNTRLMSGLCPVRLIIDNNIDVGLGTDVSGGDSVSILDAIRRTMDVSAHLELNGSQGAAISWKEAVYLATLGGAKALSLEDKIGNFAVGKHLDALIIDAYATGGAIDKHEYEPDVTKEEHAENTVQRFIYTGDDRNIISVFVKGEKVK